MCVCEKERERERDYFPHSLDLENVISHHSEAFVLNVWSLGGKGSDIIVTGKFLIGNCHDAGC